MKKILLLNIILLISLNSCEKENPSISETGNGKVLITSNVEKGEIFVANEFTGLYTPDTLELLAVKHKVKVRKAKYFSEEREISFKKDELTIEYFDLNENNLKKNILIENFTDYDCTSCFSNPQFDELKKIYGEQIQIINYPVVDGNSDLFADIKQFVDLRQELYNILFLPHLFLDGKTSENVFNDFDKRLLEEPKFEITIGDTIAQGGILVLSVFLDVYDLDGIEFEHLVLYNLITENKVNISALGTNADVDYLVRGFFNNPNGISLAGISEKGRARFAVSGILNPFWKKEDLTIISFVQNNYNKEIYQVGTTKINM
jgi:hypothetical protein